MSGTGRRSHLDRFLNWYKMQALPVPSLSPKDRRTLTMATSAASGVHDYSISKVIAASAVGTMIEWYDFYIFGSLAAYLSPKFFPPGNDTFAYIAYLATFAVGFLVRPFGALFFGRIGDLVGRKYAFIITLTIMGGATAVVGMLPTYATAGWLAPVL